MRSLESLKKEAKRLLDALQANDPAARARLERHLPDIVEPTLRDVQFVLAREHGFDGWAALKERVEHADRLDHEAGDAALARYEAAAAALLEAYRTGTPEAMEAHYRYTWHRRAWPAMRTYVLLDLGKRDPDADIALEDAHYLIAREHGFADWEALVSDTRNRRTGERLAAKPVGIDVPSEFDDDKPLFMSRRWNDVLAELAKHPAARLRASGEMTDEIVADVAGIQSVTSLDFGGSKRLTDDGLRLLARLPDLRHLDVSGTAITDEGLSVLRDLPNLETLSLAGTRITDAGAAQLAHCAELREVNLAWTHTGDGAIRALAGKPKLAHFHSGAFVTDAGVPLLHELPVFKTWHGGKAEMALLSYRAAPNQLTLRGSFTDRGMESMRGLDGVFGLNVDDSNLAITAKSLAPFSTLPHLAWLAVDAEDDWMAQIAEMPALRFLGVQDTPAGDDGFVALSKSKTIEQIWGRRCHNLRRRGFVSLSTMPALRGLSVSCLNVDDAGISSLPSFPALRELMPMDIPDAGYVHVGGCSELESLILMYCRDTTDAATEHVPRLRKLKYYFNSYTTITDRTPELLSEMDSLERVTFDTCHNLTDAGVARLARLPRLKRVSVSGRGITPAVAAAFPPSVSVRYWGG